MIRSASTPDAAQIIRSVHRASPRRPGSPTNFRRALESPLGYIAVIGVPDEDDTDL